jgi:hypothetical protein
LVGGVLAGLTMGIRSGPTRLDPAHTLGTAT